MYGRGVTGTIYIDDLAKPQFPATARPLLDALTAMADSCPFDSAVLHERATSETGLSDFGSQDYRDRLDVLLREYGAIPNPTPAGRSYTFAQLLTFLKARLHIIDYLKQNPDVSDLDVPAPMIIAGLPRTGTTHLHSLLAADPAWRALPYWEALEPLPAPGEEGTVEPRRTRTTAALGASDLLIPHFPLMHEMTTDHVHEDIGLLAYDFTSGFFETLTCVPGWVEYFQAHDQTPSYRFLRLMLQVLQHQRGPNRWILKAPSHLEQFPVLTKVFPDATFIITHRDPVDVAVSMATMMVYVMRMTADQIDVPHVAAHWVDRIDSFLSACMRDRDVLPADRSIDVRFDEFMADDLGMVQRIWDIAGYEPTAESRTAVESYMAGHERNRLGRIEYRAEDLGLDKDELRARFAPYVERFVRPS